MFHFGFLYLSLKRLDFLPSLEHLFFLFGEVYRHNGSAGSEYSMSYPATSETNARCAEVAGQPTTVDTDAFK